MADLRGVPCPTVECAQLDSEQLWTGLRTARFPPPTCDSTGLALARQHRNTHFGSDPDRRISSLVRKGHVVERAVFDTRADATAHRAAHSGGQPTVRSMDWRWRDRSHWRQLGRWLHETGRVRHGRTLPRMNRAQRGHLIAATVPRLRIPQQYEGRHRRGWGQLWPALFGIGD